MNTEINAEGLFTQDQKDYVASVKDEDLRDHLLHQVRLRDNMEKDRDAFEKLAGQWPSLEKACYRLIVELKQDKSEGSYYYAWQANIAMAFKDEFERRMGDQDTCVGKHTLHIIANEAAKNFLDLLIKE